MACKSDVPNTVSAFLASAPDTTRPICKELRAIIKKAAPKLKEVMKWNTPCYEGIGLVCGFGAFKKHASLSFFRAKDLKDPNRLLQSGLGNASMRSVKFESVAEISKSKLAKLVKEAVVLDAQGVAKRTPRSGRTEISIPPELKSALKQAPDARKFFHSLPPSGRREFNEWITKAKREVTKKRRLDTTIDLLNRGERLNEKYR